MKHESVMFSLQIFGRPKQPLLIDEGKRENGNGQFMHPSTHRLQQFLQKKNKKEPLPLHRALL